MLFAGCLIVAIGLIAVHGLRDTNGSLEDVYSNQMASSLAINASQNLLSRARFGLDRAVFHPDAQDVEKTLGRAKDFIKQSDVEWQRYLALPRDAEEDRLAKDVEAERRRYIDEGLLALAGAVERADADKIEHLSMKALTALFGKYDKAANALNDYQFQTAKGAYERSRDRFAFLTRLCVGAMIVGAFLLATSSVLLLRAIMRPLHRMLGHFERMSAGDLSHPIEVERSDEMGQLLTGLAAMQRQLATTVRSVRDSSSAIATASGEIATGNLDLSARTEQQAGNIEETASSLEELTTTVRHNADNVRQANQVAQSAAGVAMRGGQLISQVIETMGAIDGSSKRIVDIIAVIDGIAFQTNILALNAAVEAARAGEQGRGFAVVASEVRNLAQRSASAAKEIKDLITDSVANVDAGTALVGKAGVTMGEIVDSVTRMTDIMSEVLAAGEEQNSGIGQINDAVGQMDQVTQQNAALVEEAAAATAALQDQAVALQELVSVFKLDEAAGRQGERTARRAGPTHLALAVQ
jgi:methyl-accepting chemotaxis protein-1 (serine sensor receptor)